MYRAVMEQVVRFLERAYKNLDLIKNKMDPGGSSNKSDPSRVPRSRSVHTVDVSPSRECPKYETQPHFPRAKSIAQIEASPNYSTFRDFTWRRPRQTRSDPDEVPPDKLSQEAFRLLRTIQSLLNTREPDLVQRLCPELEREMVLDHDSSDSHCSSPSLAIPGPGNKNLHTVVFQSRSKQKPEPVSLSTGSCSSLLRQSLDASSLRSINYNTNNSSLTSGLESAFAGRFRTTPPSYTSSLGRPQKCKAHSPPVLELGYEPRDTINSSPPVPQLSVSSTEDESGFSSMNSFQEVGLPLINPSKTPAYSKQSSSYNETHYQSKTQNSTSQPAGYCGSGCLDLGLPVVDIPSISSDRNGTTPMHRRCSSSPAETISQNSKNNASFHGAGEMLRVLWV
ncbi:hypothetical protein L798_13404 [Zootermopsis nevadensis]|uniref:Uncharacterized protein n=2 Tax=Zootermopsis nevadensis TaxID=136037 RepID=A0A067QTT9_ZOONE|nr:hypothetical protein L798_13404 [Zootermopsis nevadensis]